MNFCCTKTFRHSTTVNVNVFRGLIGPVICVKELNEEQIHHLFALGGNYERVLFDERYDFSNEIMNEYIKSVEMLGGNADIYIVLFDDCFCADRPLLGCTDIRWV